MSIVFSRWRLLLRRERKVFHCWPNQRAYQIQGISGNCSFYILACDFMLHISHMLTILRQFTSSTIFLSLLSTWCHCWLDCKIDFRSDNCLEGWAVWTKMAVHSINCYRELSFVHAANTAFYLTLMQNLFKDYRCRVHLMCWPSAHPPTLLYCVERILSTQVGSYVRAVTEVWYKK